MASRRSSAARASTRAKPCKARMQATWLCRAAAWRGVSPSLKGGRRRSDWESTKDWEGTKSIDREGTKDWEGEKDWEVMKDWEGMRDWEGKKDWADKKDWEGKKDLEGTKARTHKAKDRLPYEEAPVCVRAR